MSPATALVMRSGSSRRNVVSSRIVPRSLSPLKKLEVEQARTGKRPDLPVGAQRRDALAVVVTQVVVEETAARVGHGKAVLHYERRTRAAIQLRRKVERERELRRIQLVVEPDALDAEPARAGKALQAQLLGREAPFPELGFADVERAVGGEEAHAESLRAPRRSRSAAPAGACGGRALDAGLAFRRLGLRGRWRTAAAAAARATAIARGFSA